MGLKCNENFRKDEHANENVGLSMKKDELDEFLNKYRNEMLRTTSFDAKTFLASRKYGGLTRHANHSCNHNFQITKCSAQGYLCLGVLAKRSIEKAKNLKQITDGRRIAYRATPSMVESHLNVMEFCN